MSLPRMFLLQSTRPDYLVNRDDQKNEGHTGKKNCTEIDK